MTTPERLRRRQRFEGAGLLVLGLLVAASTVFGETRDDKQDRTFKECIVSIVSDISSNSDARASLNALDTAATNRVILRVASAGGDRTAIQTALDDFKNEQKSIAEAREKNKVPPFPDGKCQ